MDSMLEILGEDEIRDCVDELCEDLKDLGQVEFVHLLWARKDKDAVKERSYGCLETVVFNLERAKFEMLLREHKEVSEDADSWIT